MRSKQRVVVWIISILLLAFVAGCRKKVPVSAMAPPSPSPSKAQVAPRSKAPTISEFIVEPSTIVWGQSVALRWGVNDASDIEINQGIGAVSSVGDRRVLPNKATTYTLLAKGPGGTAMASATVSVTGVPPSPPATLGTRQAVKTQDALWGLGFLYYFFLGR